MKIEGFTEREFTEWRYGGRDRLYPIWEQMKQRCYNPNHKEYLNYGGKGITICDEWLNDYGAFKAWAEKSGYDKYAPRGNCTIDRIDNDKGYSPENCRWATIDENNRNKGTYTKDRAKTKSYKGVEINGEVKSVKQWSIESGIKERTIRSRLEAGKTGQDLLKEVRYSGPMPVKNGPPRSEASKQLDEILDMPHKRKPKED